MALRVSSAMLVHIARPLCSVNCSLLRVCNVQFSSQSHLPRQPVPSMRKTMEEMMDAADVMLSSNELRETQSLIKEFFTTHGDGEELQKHLRFRASSMDNWINEYILTSQFLKNRSPLPFQQNAAFISPVKFNVKTLEDQLHVAAKILTSIANTIERIKRDEFPPDKMNDIELDMSHYKDRNELYRVVGRGQDLILKREDRKHALIVRNNQYFEVDLFDNSGEAYKDEQFLKVLMEAAAQSKDKGTPIGVLSGDDRDIWAELYAHLIKDETNKCSLDSMHSALIVLCLDEPCTHPSQYNDLTSVTRSIFHGEGSQQNGGNRFYDNEYQVILGRDGSLGASLGQVLAGAWALLPIMTDIPEYLKDHRPTSNNIRPPPQIKKLEIHIDDKTKAAIMESCKRFDRRVDTFDIHCASFDAFGKDVMKSCGVSPDTFVQLAVGLAMMKIHEEGGYDLELAHARKFYKGRTGIVRTCFRETVEFQKSMMSEEASSTETRDKFRRAAIAHQFRIKMAMNGYSPGRHVQGLKSCADELGIKPKLFEDPGFIKVTTPRSTNTQVPPSSIFYNVNSLFGGQYSNGFVPYRNYVLWSSVTENDSGKASAKDIYSSVCESLSEIRNLFKSTSSNFR